MIYVSDLMTDTVFTLHPDDNLSDVRILMKLAKIRHTPVVDDEHNFLGLISHRDLLDCTISRLAEIDESIQNEIDSAISVQEVMHREIMCVHPNTLLRDAAQVLFEEKYGCLPVLDGRRLVGIVTESDFLRLSIVLLGGVE